MRSSISLIWRSRDSFYMGTETWVQKWNRARVIEKWRREPCVLTQSLFIKKKRKDIYIYIHNKKGNKWTKWDAAVNTHSALEWVDLTGVGLDLVPVLHALLLGLTQWIVVLIHSLVQIGHLTREGEKVSAVQQLKETICVSVCVFPSYLRLVPLLSLWDVLGGNALVLHADVPQSSSQVGFRHVHLDLHLSVLHLVLQLTDLLRDDEEE